jgi:peptidoglycan/xylan/chitin deacetylase (PgdA/CDA1 family)
MNSYTVKFLIVTSLIGLFLLTGCQTTEKPKPAELPPDAKLVCLFFDDGWMNQYEAALPVLIEHDFGATFGIITGSIGRGNEIWEYMGEEELKELDKHGMEIAGHTKTHPRLTDNLTDEQLHEEIINSKKHLEKIGFKINTLVYPYYEWDDRVVEYAKEADYKCARAGWSEELVFNLETVATDTRFHIPSISIIDQDLETFSSFLDEADNDSAVCLVYHFISDIGPEETSTPVINFKKQMAYLKGAGFTVLPVSDLLVQ